jgi:glycine betaine/proline transport system permease protein
MGIEILPLPIGQLIEIIVDFLLDNFGGLFDGFARIIRFFLFEFELLLRIIPSYILIAFIAILIWIIKKNIFLVLFVIISLGLILNLKLWPEFITTLASILTAVFVSTLIGIPLGILKAHNRFFDIISRPILDMMQTIPVFVYLIPALMFFGLGVVSGVIATIVFALPPPIKLTYLGIKQVSEELKEAGEAFGSNRWQMLIKIELPAAMPSIMMGINQCIMMSLSMVVIASMIGAGGLGQPVMRSMATVDVGKGFESGLAVVMVAMILDRLFVKE